VGAALGLPALQRVAVVVAAALAFLVYGWRRLLAEEERVALRAVLT